MIEQIGTAITFGCFYAASKVGKASLTVTVDVFKRTPSATTQLVTGGSATEIGDGLYFYQLAAGSVDVEALYFAVFKTADTTVDLQHLPALWCVGKAGVENLDAAISTRAVEANVQSHAAAALTAYAPATGAALTAGLAAIPDAVWNETMSDHIAAGSTGKKLSDTCCTLGSGPVQYLYTVTDGDTGLAIPGVTVTVTSDLAGAVVIASSLTNAFGKITFLLSSGVYYFWLSKAGYTFSNPDTETVP